MEKFDEVETGGVLEELSVAKSTGWKREGGGGKTLGSSPTRGQLG